MAESKQKGKQPLPKIPAFPVVSSVLEFYDCRHQCRKLMMSLSKVSEKFVTDHDYTFQILAQAPPQKLALITLHQQA